jgi:hypothetical protein
MSFSEGARACRFSEAIKGSEGGGIRSGVLGASVAAVASLAVAGVTAIGETTVATTTVADTAIELDLGVGRRRSIDGA